MFVAKTGIKDFIKDLEKAEKKARTQAAKYLVKKIKNKLIYSKNTKSLPNTAPVLKTRRLKRGIKYVNEGNKTKVGAAPPAYHAHLLEFGTSNRQTRKNENRGRILPRPFLIPTFTEENEKVKEIIKTEISKNV